MRTMSTTKTILSDNGIDLKDIGSIALFERIDKDKIPEYIKERGRSNKVYDPLGAITTGSEILDRELPFKGEKEKMIAGYFENKRYGYSSFSILTNEAKITIVKHK